MQREKDKKGRKLDRELLAGRSSKETIDNNVACIKSLQLNGKLKLPTFNILLVLNKNRQIVYASKNLFKLLGKTKESEVYGQRVGEILKCQNSVKTKGRCGTSKACMECGALLTILSGLEGQEAESECRIIQKDTNKAFDFAIYAFPLEEKGKPFVVVSIKDISSVKRREVLERIFLHDLLNVAGGIQGLSSLLTDLPEKKRNRAIGMIQQISTELVEEIQGQRELLRAERGDLQPIFTDSTTGAIIDRQLALYTNHSITKKRSIEICPEAVDKPIRTDTSLLGRVIGNMIKNALEASKLNQTVTVSCKECDKDHVEFNVHNEAFIPRNNQLKIFQRSFSTKGPGRGVGTYCIKLLTENYLHGKVRFESNKKKGTTFYLRVPL